MGTGATCSYSRKRSIRAGVMDKLDQSILSILQRDGRAPNAQIARGLGVSEGTVRRRLTRLLREGFFRVEALLEPTAVGYNTSALIGLHVDLSRIEQIADRLAQLKETEFVVITTGSYDIFTWVNVASPNQLTTFLHTKVGPIAGVKHTGTFVTLTTKKRSPGPLFEG